MARIATRRTTAVAASLWAALSVQQASAQTQTGSADPTALVAEQIRQQGYSCAEPASATQDAAVDDDAVWTLTCADAAYRVRLVPDQAAQVEKLR